MYIKRRSIGRDRIGLLLVAGLLILLMHHRIRNQQAFSVTKDFRGFKILPKKHLQKQLLDGDVLNISVLLSMDENHEFFSGYGQDRTVFSLLDAAGLQGKKGFFIDLAARHPLETSNTRALERNLGWSGLCIEANERYWDKLATLRNYTVSLR